MHRTHAPMPFFKESFGAFAKRVTCPTLFVGGGAHGFHPADEAERVACFAHLTRIELPEAGHMMHWTEPECLAAALVQHWRG
jgi:pimeloyl-ACP methyl ester carboxylesterase